MFQYILSVIYSWEGKAGFSAAMQSSVSHDLSEIILTCYFFQDSLITRKFKINTNKNLLHYKYNSSMSFSE